jgi:hypothetical protein
MKAGKAKKQGRVSTKRPAKKRSTFKKSQRPAGWTEELEREWEESGPHAYDKAKWHYEGDYPKGLPEKQAFVHTGLFFGWLIERDMISREFRSLNKQFKQKKLTGPQVYEIWDGCLASDMLMPEANEFARDYYDGHKFAADYQKLLVRGLPSWYHVEDTWANYELLKRQIDSRYEAWKKKQRKRKKGR